MKSVMKNDIITIAFTGKLDNGTEFMSVDRNKPMKIRIGANELPPTVENALIGLEAGGKRKIRVSPEEAYGQRQKSLLQTITNKAIIEKINPRPGMIVALKVNREGQDIQVPATVMEVKDDAVVVDYNHPLAGHHLTYEITVLEIEKA